jgi:O-antigen/teichoic acid export membrane protein
MALLGVFVAVGGSMTAWRVVPALPGLGEFDGAGVALALLAPAAALILVATIVQGTLLAARHERTVLWISLVGLAVNVALIAVLIPTLSYVGAALATALTELVLIVCSVAAVRRRLALSWPVERLPALLGTALLTAAALTVGYLLPPLLQLTLGVVVFAAASLATGALRMGELRQALGRPATV